MDEHILILEAEYCPPLDPALLSAILSDFDLSSAQSLQDARDTLDQLKESALTEEAADFDPSGTGAYASHEDVESCPDTSFSLSKDTDTTSLSAGLSSLDIDDAPASPDFDATQDLENQDEETKIALLQDIFGTKVSKYSIRHTLQKNQGKWQPTLEELLNHAYFNETETTDDNKVSAKGIDAFAEGNSTKRGRKHKSKAKKVYLLDERRSSSVPSAVGQDSPAPQNRWQASATDIEFIASRMRIPTKTVSSTYYANGASTAQTIAALIKVSTDQSKHIVDDDAAIDMASHELSQEFPSIVRSYIATIVRLTHPSMSSARDLAAALVAKPDKANMGGLSVVPRYAPVNEAELNGDESFDSRTKSMHSTMPLHGDVADRATSYAAMKSTAYAQARSAFRRAKSNRLMGGAAAYYSEVARENSALHSTASAVVADQLADSQASPTHLDLHGIDVLNGVRIAQQKVEQWWSGLGESRVNGRIGVDDRQAGYQIIVGLGKHSTGGKSKLGPAVSKMLRENGWKFDTTGASIVVRGKAKR